MLATIAITTATGMKILRLTAAVLVLSASLFATSSGELKIEAGTTLAPSSQSPAQRTVLAPLNLPHEQCAAVEVGGKIYALGGPNTALEEFEPALGRWKVITSMPAERDFFGLAALDHALFVIGGLSRSNEFRSTVELYDLLTRTWRTAAPLPTPRNRLAAVVLGQKIYLIGGMISRDQNTGAVEEYDPLADHWRPCAPMPTPRHAHALVVFGGKILALGGFEIGHPLAVVEEYDPATDRWTKKTDMLTRRGFFGAGVV
jgi:hypothetical protein